MGGPYLYVLNVPLGTWLRSLDVGFSSGYTWLHLVSNIRGLIRQGSGLKYGFRTS